MAKVREIREVKKDLSKLTEKELTTALMNAEKALDARVALEADPGLYKRKQKIEGNLTPKSQLEDDYLELLEEQERRKELKRQGSIALATLPLAAVR